MSFCICWIAISSLCAQNLMLCTDVCAVTDLHVIVKQSCCCELGAKIAYAYFVEQLALSSL